MLQIGTWKQLPSPDCQQRPTVPLSARAEATALIVQLRALTWHGSDLLDVGLLEGDLGLDATALQRK